MIIAIRSHFDMAFLLLKTNAVGDNLEIYILVFIEKISLFTIHDHLILNWNVKYSLRSLWGQYFCTKNHAFHCSSLFSIFFLLNFKVNWNVLDERVEMGKIREKIDSRFYKKITIFFWCLTSKSLLSTNTPLTTLELYIGFPPIMNSVWRP